MLRLKKLQTALALKCYECTNIPGLSGVSKCDDEKVKSTTCGSFMDRCMTIEGTVTVPNAGSVEFEMKNCSSSILCNPDSSYNMCKILNDTTGMMSKCNIACCEGDYCNASNAAVRISGLVACLLAVLLALFLN